MKFIAEFNPLVIVGQWNSAIFTPEWVGKYLMPQTKFNVEVLLNNINGSLRFSNDELRFFIFDGKFNFVILKQDNEVYSKIGQLAYDLVNYLPHTPVSAFGINYKFECEKADKIESLFSFNDDSLIKEQGYENTNTIIRRQLVKGNDILNLSVTKNEDKYNIDLNYHYEIKSIIEFKDKFEPDNIVRLKEESLIFLNSIYDLKIEEND